METKQEKRQENKDVIADGKVDAYLWEGWDKGMKSTFDIRPD